MRRDFERGSGLLGDMARARALLNETESVASRARQQLQQLHNQTTEYYEWVRTHLLLSHGRTHSGHRGHAAAVRVCLPISITTRHSRWTHLSEMLLLKAFLPSLVRTAEPGYFYGVYLGYDEGDPLLDSEEGQQELRSLFAKTVGSAPIELRAFRYADSRNRNVWAVNYVARECYFQGYDYFYRVNDDSAFHSQNWASRLVPRLQELNDFGVVGVLDKHNPRIFTHSLVGRPHLEVFGYYFPFEFGNYWSDDWITLVYTPPYVVRAYDVEINHHRHAERYKVEWERKTLLDDMVNYGRRRWRTYLCVVRKKQDFCRPKLIQEFAHLWKNS